MTHLNDAHDQGIFFDHLKFDNETIFLQWLIRVQVDTPCSFQKQSGSDPLKNCVYYYCSRSGSRYDQHVGERKRRLKVQGIAKVGYTCPAHLVMYRMSDKRVEVKYVAKHFCHSSAHEQLGHIRISRSDRIWIAEKLAVEVPMDVVLRDILNESDGTLQRSHVVTKNDLTNIERSLHLNRPEFSSDRSDLANVLRAYDGGEYSPIILYKRQGTCVVDIFPEADDVRLVEWEENDFLFGMMSTSQCQMLNTYGTGEASVICVDSTHTTNPKQTCFGTSMKRTHDFHLSTLMVLDSSSQGFPVAFLYSNRQTEATFILFLQAVRSRSGLVGCNTFMSDMTPQFYNAWKCVMGDSVHRLYYSWHVDKSFRDHTRRLIRDDEELPVIVYRQLRALMCKPDLITFEASLPVLVQQLRDNSSTVAFGKFFDSHYVNCVESWAFCYRSALGMDTDIHLQRMHDIFKHVYEQGKKHQRLDGAIASLLHMVFDKEFNNLTGLCKVNEKKLSELRSRHEESLLMTEAITSEVTAGREWIVIADNEVFTVLRVREDRCGCDLQCNECQACIDTYLCCCDDSAIAFNMCKHIHLICTYFPSVDDLALDTGEQTDDCIDFVFSDDANDDFVAVRNEEEEVTEESQDVESYTDDKVIKSEASLSVSQETVKQLCNEMALLVESIKDNAQVRHIIESLRAVKPKLQYVNAEEECSAMGLS